MAWANDLRDDQIPQLRKDYERLILAKTQWSLYVWVQRIHSFKTDTRFKQQLTSVSAVHRAISYSLGFYHALMLFCI